MHRGKAVSIVDEAGRYIGLTRQLIIPTHNEHDLPHIARRLRQLADELIIIHRLDGVKEQSKLFRAQQAISDCSRKLKKECPK
jgi:cob(I)alamin adenosyltransferase